MTGAREERRRETKRTLKTGKAKGKKKVGSLISVKKRKSKKVYAQ